MTDDQDPRNGPLGQGESRACLLMVASYTDVAGALEPAIASIATRILASPMLGDFLELRFVNAGPRPVLDGTPTVVPHIVDALTSPEADAAQNYFALVFADQSAAMASRMLQDCRSEPALAGLPVEYRGLAAIDDRPDGAEGPGQAVQADGSAKAGDSAAVADAIADIAVAASGKWTAHDLSDELLRYAEQLFRYFASTHERGVTRDELAQIRDSRHAGSPAQSPSEPADDMHDNLLDVVPEAPPDSAPGPPEQAAPSLPDRAAPSRPLPVPAQALPAAEPGTDAPRSWPRLPRLLQWRHTQPRSPDADPPIAAAGGPAPAVPAQTGPPKLILMLLYGDADPDERSSWRRGRSLMLRVDEGLAAARPGAFKVRALSGKGGSARTPLREAGCLSSRDIRRPDQGSELGLSLRHLHSVLYKDRTAVGHVPDADSGSSVVVIFAAEIPVADVITAEAYIALSLDTSIIWVVPEGGHGLMSQTFATSETLVIADHTEVADEVVTMMLASAAPQEAPADEVPASHPEPVSPAAFTVTDRTWIPKA